MKTTENKERLFLSVEVFLAGFAIESGFREFLHFQEPLHYLSISFISLKPLKSVVTTIT